MYYKLERHRFRTGAENPCGEDGKAVRGQLYSVEHRYSGSTGQYKEYLTPVCPTLENADYLVPALVYRVDVTQSAKFKRLLPCLRQVPGRTGIRFHRGARPEHSRGCILVSAADEQLLTAKWLNEQHNHEEIYLSICSAH